MTWNVMRVACAVGVKVVADLGGPLSPAAVVGQQPLEGDLEPALLLHPSDEDGAAFLGRLSFHSNSFINRRTSPLKNRFTSSQSRGMSISGIGSGSASSK